MASSAIAPSEKTPVSHHRAFPAVVALWFAALLGCGTLVMPTILLERAVEVSGLANTVPAAAPPLGQTAHSLVALAAGLTGALLGFLIARRVARAHAPSYHGPAIFAPSDDLEPGDALDPVLDDVQPAAPKRDIREPIDDAPVEIEEDAPLEQFPTFAELERRRAQRRAPEPENIPATIERRLFLRRSEDEPLVFTAPSLSRLSPDNENSAEVATDREPGEDALAAFLRPAAELDAPIEAVSAPLPTWQREPLHELGLVHLVERLGAALAQRRAALAKPREESAAPPPASGLEVAPPEDAARAMAAYFANSPIVTRDEADEASHDDEAFGSLLTLRAPAPERDDPEAALRKALATLQKMSGAA